MATKTPFLQQFLGLVLSELVRQERDQVCGVHDRWGQLKIVETISLFLPHTRVQHTYHGGPHKYSLAFDPKLACECHLSIHNRLSFRCPFHSFTISNNACKNQVWFVSVFYFIPIGVVFQSQKRCLIFGHLLKTICSKNLNSYNILSHIYWNVHYFLAIHLAILVLQELFIFSPRGQLRYLRLQVRVRVGPSLGRVAQIGIFDKSQLQESHFTLTTLIMHHMEHIQLLHLESKVRDILKMPRIFQIHGIFKILGIFKQDIQ